jgi:hypothetical protein
MATATMATIDPILKEVYAPRIEDQLQSEVSLLMRLESTTEGLVDSPGGKYVDFPIRTGRNSGVGSRLENEALPAAGTQSYAQVKVPLRADYGLVRFTGHVIKMARTNPQAFADAADREMEGLKEDLIKNTNRVVQGDGTGILAAVSADGAANITAVVSTQYLEVGQQIDILNRTTGAAVALDRTITAINGLNVTYSGVDVATAATDGIYRQGNFTGAVQREATGLGKIISNGVLHGLDSAVQNKWQSSILANGGTTRALSEGLMIQMCDTVYTASGKKPSAIFTSLGVRRSYFNLLTQQRRYTETKTFAGGMQGLPFNYGSEIPVVADIDAPPSRMRFVCEKELAMLKNTDWEWADETGDILVRVANFDVYEGMMRKFWELATRQRNAHGEIQDITEG